MKSSKRNLTRGGVLRRIAAAFLAGVFALGIAAASPIDAKAAGEDNNIEITTTGFEAGKKIGDIGMSVTWNGETLSFGRDSWDSFFFGLTGPGVPKIDETQESEDAYNNTALEAGKTYRVWGMAYKTIDDEFGEETFSVKANGVSLQQEEDYIPDGKSSFSVGYSIEDDSQNVLYIEFDFTVTIPGGSDSTSANVSTVSTPHKHHMEWEVVTEPTEDADGVIAYRCSECGYTEYQQPLASFGVYNYNLAKQIRNAAANGTITVNAAKRGWISYAPEVFRALKDRPDVTLVTDYRYKGVLYEMTIPAGADLTALGDLDSLNPGDCFGYRFLAQYFTTIEQ